MGRPKLLLPLGNATVIARVLRVLRRPEIAEVVVVVRADDSDLRSAVTAAGGTAISPPVDPPEMRDSAQFALDWIRQTYRPQPADGWILSPADHPLLDADVLSALIARFRVGDASILVPTWQGKRGHPVMFGWHLAAEVAGLPADKGLNEIVRRHAVEVVDVPVASGSILVDLDTPADYERLVAQHAQERLTPGP